MVVHQTTTTRVQTQDGETAAMLTVPPEVAEALVLVQSDSPLVAAEGFSKLSHATFNNRVLRGDCCKWHHPRGFNLICVCKCRIARPALAKEAAGAIGAVRAIADAMARNVENGTVQEDGCHALRNAAFRCGAFLGKCVCMYEYIAFS